MNDLTVLSAAELKDAIEKLKERESSFKTTAGKKYAVSKMREFITLLETWGYTFEGNEDSLAVLWAKSFKEEIIRIGYDGFGEAIEMWVKEDQSEYRSFPKIPWIKEICSSIGGDPRAEQGRRIQAENERQMELDHKREMAELEKSFTPSQLEEIERKARELSEFGNKERHPGL